MWGRSAAIQASMSSSLKPAGAGSPRSWRSWMRWSSQAPLAIVEGSSAGAAQNEWLHMAPRSSASWGSVMRCMQLPRACTAALGNAMAACLALSMGSRLCSTSATTAGMAASPHSQCRSIHRFLSAASEDAATAAGMQEAGTFACSRPHSFSDRSALRMSSALASGSPS